MERCSITSRGRVEEVDGSEDGVGINSRATTVGIGSEITASGVFVGLSGN